jgi:hypothetical protein
MVRRHRRIRDSVADAALNQVQTRCSVAKRRRRSGARGDVECRFHSLDDLFLDSEWP